MVRGMAAECKEKEGASDAEVDDMIDKKMPTTQPGKCLNACMMDQFGIVRSSWFLNRIRKHEIYEKNMVSDVRRQIRAGGPG